MKLISLLEGLALGAGLMYAMDPDNGRRRRSTARDRVKSEVRNKQRALGVMQRDFVNRSQGMVTQIKAARTQGDIVSDEIVEARIRSALGRVCTHCRAVMVEVHDGEVTLSGNVLASEIQAVVQCVKNTKGVAKVANELDVIHDPSHISNLQGEGRLPQKGTWTPATGLVMTGLGGAMTLYGIAKRGFIGTLVGGVGLAMVGKAFHDTEQCGLSSGSKTSDRSADSLDHVATGSNSGDSVSGFEGMNATYTDSTDETIIEPETADENAGWI